MTSKEITLFLNNKIKENEQIRCDECVNYDVIHMDKDNNLVTINIGQCRIRKSFVEGKTKRERFNCKPIKR